MSEIRVDTISEKTSANGVAIDGLTIKDGGISATTGSIVFNEASADVDFRVESNGNTHMLFVDGGNNNVAIGTSNVSSTAPLSISSGFAKTDTSSRAVLNLQSNEASAQAQLRVMNIGGASAADRKWQLQTSEAGVANAGQLEFQVDGGSVQMGATGGGLFFLNSTNTVFNEGSTDTDFRVESNSYAHCLFVDGGNDRVGVGENSDIGGLFRVSLGDSGVTSVNSAGQALIIEDDANTGLTIATPTDGTGAILFADSGDNDRGRIAYDHSNDRFFIDTNGNDVPAMYFHSSNALSTSGETAPDVGEGGITLDQNANDGNIFTMKSSDIAHGFTGIAETDSYSTFSKGSGTDGGLKIQGFHEGQGFGVQILAYCKTAGYTASNTTGYGHLDFIARGSDGSTSVAALDADENIMSVRNHNDVKFIVKGDGDLFADGTLSAYDTYEDAQLVRAFDLSHGKGVIDSTFDKYVKYNHETLANANLVGREEDGTPNHFINVTGMQRLHNGAIWQQYEKTERLTQAMYELAKAAVGEEKANEILEQNEIKLLN